MRRLVRSARSVTGITPLDEPQRDEALEYPAGLGTHGLLDLVVACPPGRDRAQHQLAEVTEVSLRGEHQLTLVEQAATGRASQSEQVGAHRSPLVPPAQIERDPADDSPDERLIGRGEARKQLGRLVWLERMNQQRDVEATVERGALLLHRVHRAHRRAAQQDAQLRLLAGAVPEGAQDAWELRACANQLRELVDHQQQPLALCGGGERLERVVPVGERPRVEVAGAGRGYRGDASAEQAQLVGHGPPGGRVEDRTPLPGKPFDQRRLADASAAPDESESAIGLAVPALEFAQLLLAVHEHSTQDSRRQT